MKASAVSNRGYSDSAMLRAGRLWCRALDENHGDFQSIINKYVMGVGDAVASGQDASTQIASGTFAVDLMMYAPGAFCSKYDKLHWKP
jgi:hypothetical protein